MRSVQNTTENVFKVITLLQNREFVTIRDICENCNMCYESAKKYLDAASLYMPITEDGLKKTTGPPAVKYKLIKGE